jgi:Zn-dependent protease with chaperone function
LAFLGVVSLVTLWALCTAFWRWIRLEAQVEALHLAAPVELVEGEPVRLVAGPGVQIFAAGLRDPAIFASAAAFDLMPRSQLWAAIMHERSHLLNNDTRFRPVLSSLRFSLGWVRPVKRAVSQAVLREECRADAFAIAAGASPSELAGAILAVNGASLGSAANLGDGDVALRLSRLADPGSPLPGQPERTLTIAALSILSIPVLAHVGMLLGF